MKITYKVLLVLVATIFGLLTITTTYELTRLRKKFETESQDLHRTIAANLVDNLSAALFNVDRKRITRQIESAFQFGQINRIVVLDDTAMPLGAFEANQPGTPPEELNAKNAEELGLDVSRFLSPRQEYKEKLIDIIETEALPRGGTQRLTTTLWFSDDDRRIFVGHLLLEFDNRAVVQAIRQSIFDKLASAFFLALVMCGLTFMVLQFVVLRRLEGLKASVRSVQARDYSRPIEIKGRDEIAILARAFRDMVNEIQAYQQGLEEKVRERTRDLQRSRDKIKNILDNIEEGIITFAPDLAIDSEYSHKTLEILDVSADELQRRSLMQTLIQKSRLSADRIQQIDETLKCTLGSDEISWLANHHALPTELDYQTSDATRILGLEWVPLYHEDTQIVERALLTIRDLTPVRILEQQRKTEAAQNDRILTLVKLQRHMGAPKIHSFLQNSLHSIQRARHHLNDRATGLILLHTLKGEARTLQLQSLAEAAHEAETDFKENNTVALARSLQTLEASVQAWLDVFMILHLDEAEGRASFVRTAAQILDDVSHRALKAGIQPGDIQIINQVAVWDDRLVDEVLSPCLTHALNNALDHGYIFPEKRHQEGRSLKLTIRAWQEKQDILVEIKDQGYGIDAELILKTATEQGLAVSSMRVEDILFLPEFSTAEKVTGTSGRGVGMSAIKTLVENHGGQLKLESHPGRGSTLTVRIPKNAGLHQVA
jgi:signal transduction histidine kinase/HPt (histidine-containing phosphotransfer) domain-containing protein